MSLLKEAHPMISLVHMRRVVLYSFFSLAVFILFIGTLEVVLRTTHLFGARVAWTSPDPLVGFKYMPGQAYWYEDENDHAIAGRINAFGWRDKDWSLQKPPKTHRIAILGDSFVEAFQVESEFTFAHLLEKQLNMNSAMNFEVMNFGRSGFTQSEELLTLEHQIVNFSPDMVILMFFPGNDIDDINRKTTSDLIRPFYLFSKNGELILDTTFSETTEFKIKSFASIFKRHSALISLIAERYSRYRLERLYKTLQNGSLTRLDNYLTLCTSHPNAQFVSNYRLNKALIERMANNCKKRGIRFMLVCLDNDAYITQIEQTYKVKDPTFNGNFFEDDLRIYAGTLGIDYIGLQSVFHRIYLTTGAFLHWRKGDGWGHLNYDGHGVVAAELFKKLSLLDWGNLSLKQSTN